MNSDLTAGPKFITRLSTDFISAFKKSDLSSKLKLGKLSPTRPRKYFFRKPTDDRPRKKMPSLFDQTNLTIEDSQKSIIDYDQGITSLKYLYPRKKIDFSILHRSKSICNHGKANFGNETYIIGDSWKLRG